MVSFVTAVGGGILRDTLINEVPAVLTHDFYGSIALVTGSILFMLHYFGWNNDWSVFVLAIVMVALRLIAYQNRWRLPTF